MRGVAVLALTALLGVSLIAQKPVVAQKAPLEKPSQAPASHPQPASQAAQAKVDFARDVFPIFEKSCRSCHGPDMQMGRLRLDVKQLAMRGGQSGKMIQPGAAAASILFQRVAGTSEQARMPMGGELPAEQIELIGRWGPEKTLGLYCPPAAGAARSGQSRLGQESDRPLCAGAP